MRKIILLLGTLPAIASAQSGAPWQSAVGSISGVIAPLLAVAVAVTVAIGFFKVVITGEDVHETILKLVGSVCFVGVASAVVKSLVGDVPSDTDTHNVVFADKPGALSVAGDWLGSHGMVIVGFLVLIAVGAYIGSQVYLRKAARTKVKSDLRELLAAIDYADEIEAYWTSFVFDPTVLTNTGSIRHNPKGKVEAVIGIREDLLQLLSFVHDGQPLSDEQRIELRKANEKIERCAKDADGTVVVPRDGLITVSEGDQTLALGTSRRGVHRHLAGSGQAGLIRGQQQNPECLSSDAAGVATIDLAQQALSFAMMTAQEDQRPNITSDEKACSYEPMPDSSNDSTDSATSCTSPYSGSVPND